MSRVALASGATGTDDPPLRLLSAEQLAEHQRLFGRVVIEGPCTCGDCLSCEVRSLGQRRHDVLGPDVARFALGVEL